MDGPILEPVPSSPVFGAWNFLVRLVMLAFGILQIAIVLRIVLLLLGADQSNTIVHDVISTTAPFVDPFKGMFHLDSVSTSGGAVLDTVAVVALIGWTVAEAIVVAVLNVFNRP